jgi:hypothetical protein
MTGLNFRRRITNPDFNGALVFGEMKNAFEIAYKSSTSTRWERACSFAGQRVQIRIAGNALVHKMMGAFKHLRIKDNGNLSSQLKIDLWHEVETAVVCPADLVDLCTKSLWTSWEGEYGITMGSPNDRYIACQRPSTLTCFDREARHIVAWVGDHEQLSLYETGKPLHLPLLLWHHDQEAPVVHAGLVSKNGRGTLLVGKGGSGKSTCALACLCSDFLYVGDDYIGVKIRDDGTYEGYGIYNSTWLSRDNLPRFPELAQHAIIAARPDEQKNLVLLSEVFPERLAASAPIHAVILPRIVGHGPSRPVPVGKSKALLAVAPSSIILLPSSGARSLIKLATLLERVPCYVLEVGGNIRSIPEQIDKLLDSIN